METPTTSHEINSEAKAKTMPTDKELDTLILKRQKEQLRKSTGKVISIKGWLICSLIALIYILFGVYTLDDTYLYKNILFDVLMIPCGLIGGAIILFLLRSMYRSQEKRLERQGVVTETNKLQEELEQDFFTNLVKINFKYIDKYYLQTQVQADRSFYLSCGAAVFAFGVIVTGVVMLYQNKVQQGYVVAASGILGEFVASVFFYLYNRTVIKMGEYHQKLVLTQNISLALKIANDLPDDSQVDAKKHLIEYLSKDINLYLTRLPSEGQQAMSGALRQSTTMQSSHEKV